MAYSDRRGGFSRSRGNGRPSNISLSSLRSSNAAKNSGRLVRPIGDPKESSSKPSGNSLEALFSQAARISQNRTQQKGTPRNIQVKGGKSQIVSRGRVSKTRMMDVDSSVSTVDRNPSKNNSERTKFRSKKSGSFFRKGALKNASKSTNSGAKNSRKAPLDSSMLDNDLESYMLGDSRTGRSMLDKDIDGYMQTGPL